MRHVGENLSSVMPMKTQTASCSPAPRPAPQTNCIRTLQTPYESILQQKTRRGTLERRLRPGPRRPGLASKIRARSPAFADVAWHLRTLPGNVAQRTVPTTNRITSLARFENLLAGRLKCITHFHAWAHILVLAILTSIQPCNLGWTAALPLESKASNVGTILLNSQLGMRRGALPEVA